MFAEHLFSNRDQFEKLLGGRQNGLHNEGKILISGAKSCLWDLLQIALNSQRNSTEVLGILLWISKNADELNVQVRLCIFCYLLCSLVQCTLYSFTWDRSASKTESSTWLTDWEATTLIEFAPWFGGDWDWADFWIFRHRQMRGEGGHYPWWHSYGWQTQIGASGCHHSVLLCHSWAIATVSQKHKLPGSTVCHQLSLLC